MSVRNFLRRQTDVNPHSRSNQIQSISQLERPLSEYDNITTTPATAQTHFPLGEIKFRFDDLPLTMNNSSTTSAVHCNINDDKQTTLPAHKYENVMETLQMRNQRESEQHAKTSQNDSPPRSVMSDAKSSFFGLNHSQKSKADEDFDQLIEDIGNATIITQEPNQYVNLMPAEPAEEVKANHDKVSATSSASGSSSTTVTPSASPTRHDRTSNSRKNSESSSRSKSPKFMLPESSPSSPSQVSCFPSTFIVRT